MPQTFRSFQMPPGSPRGEAPTDPGEQDRLRWIVAQEGSRQSYAVPLSFHRLGQLRLMYTDVWCRWGRSILRRGPSGARAFSTRFEPGIPSSKVVSFGGAAILRKSMYHFQRSSFTPEQHAEEFIQFGRWFAGRLRRHLGKLDLDPSRDAFFGFNTNCLECLRDLRERGIVTVVDQVDPARVEEDLVLEEADRWAGWEKKPGRMPQGYWDRLREEWDLASLVLVNSEWSADALVQQGVSRGKILTVPLAINRSSRDEPKPLKPTGRLRVLWLGSVILRKGIPYLVDAARRLIHEDIEFIVAGPVGISPEAVRGFPANIRLLGRVTRDQIDGHYAEADVFVLPTLSDGFAITQLEAMSHGLPVIATPNCGRVVTDGVDGFIVPIRDGKAIADALRLLNADRARLHAMSCKAMATVLDYDLPSNARMMNASVNEVLRAASFAV